MCFLNLEKHILRQASVTPAYTHSHTVAPPHTRHHSGHILHWVESLMRQPMLWSPALPSGAFKETRPLSLHISLTHILPTEPLIRTRPEWSSSFHLAFSHPSPTTNPHLSLSLSLFNWGTLFSTPHRAIFPRSHYHSWNCIFFSQIVSSLLKNQQQVYTVLLFSVQKYLRLRSVNSLKQEMDVSALRVVS